MPVPDFSPGEVLTANAMDSIGLWLVKTQTVGTGVSTVVVTGAFSANYDNYRVVLSGGAGSAAVAAVRLTLGATATGYYYGGKGRTFAGADINVEGANVAFWYATETTPNGMNGSVEIQNPFNTARSSYSSQWSSLRTDGYSFSTAGFLNNATSYTDFTLTLSTGTQTGGTIRVYGYRN